MRIGILGSGLVGAKWAGRCLHEWTAGGISPPPGLLCDPLRGAKRMATRFRRGGKGIREARKT